MTGLVTNSVISGNNITASSSNGMTINVSDGSYGSISNNQVYSNIGRGILIAGTINSYFDISNNSIYNNTELGIDLAVNVGTTGVTANDVDDVDAGSNLLQNYPVLTSADLVGGNWNIVGTLNGETGQTYRIDFYANSNFGDAEGQTFLGSTNVTITDATTPFDVSINASFPAVATYSAITATATRTSNLPVGATGATSEFSALVAANSIYVVDN